MPKSDCENIGGGGVITLLIAIIVIIIIVLFVIMICHGNNNNKNNFDCYEFCQTPEFQMMGCYVNGVCVLIQ